VKPSLRRPGEAHKITKNCPRKQQKNTYRAKANIVTRTNTADTTAVLAILLIVTPHATSGIVTKFTRKQKKKTYRAMANIVTRANTADTTAVLAVLLIVTSHTTSGIGACNTISANAVGASWTGSERG
jgi:hypothetical protein